MKCFFCGGVAHPATGCQYSETVIACNACTRDFWKWVQQHQAKWSKSGFYQAITTSEALKEKHFIEKAEGALLYENQYAMLKEFIEGGLLVTHLFKSPTPLEYIALTVKIESP